jgi:hypothetical protein
MKLVFNRNKENSLDVGNVGVMYRVEGETMIDDMVKAGRMNKKENHDVVSEDNGYESYVSRMKDGNAPVKFEKSRVEGDDVVQVNYEKSTNPVRLRDPNKEIDHIEGSEYTVSADQPFIVGIPEVDDGITVTVYP